MTYALHLAKDRVLFGGELRRHQIAELWRNLESTELGRGPFLLAIGLFIFPGCFVFDLLQPIQLVGCKMLPQRRRGREGRSGLTLLLGLHGER